MSNLLSVRNLSINFKTPYGLLNAVDSVSFDIKKGKTIAIVGESGCGKSVTSLAILNLIEAPGFIKSGKIIFEGEDLLKFLMKK